MNDKAANEVAVPAGGWELAAPAAAAPTAKPETNAAKPERRPPSMARPKVSTL